jgi:hypothetical protein
LEKHTSYYNLLGQLKDFACPVCAQAKKSLRNFLDSYLYEGVNDNTNWLRLSAAGGWCARHARQMEGFSDGLAVALFYRQEIRKRAAALGGKKVGSAWFVKKAPAPACPACLYQAEIEAVQLQLLSQALDEPEFAAAFDPHPGLCLPHSEGLLARLKGEAGQRYKAQAAAKLEALCLELDEIVRKSDYRSQEKMGAEGDAWKRALARIHGPDYAI